MSFNDVAIWQWIAALTLAMTKAGTTPATTSPAKNIITIYLQFIIARSNPTTPSFRGFEKAVAIYLFLRTQPMDRRANARDEEDLFNEEILLLW